MRRLPHALYRAAEVRELDRIAIEESGIPGATLMERAGRAAWDALHAQHPKARRIVVLCGVGNNAGDGFVVARLAREAGLEVRVFQVGERSRLHGDARAAADAMLDAGVDIQPFLSDSPLNDADVLVDALLGTGLRGQVAAAWQAAIAALNASLRPVIALDIPSGLDADTGQALGTAVRAQMTVTFIGLKRGMFTGAGPQHCGRIVFDDLRVPPEVLMRVKPGASRLTLQALSHKLAPRPRCAHKGDFGHVLVVGGDVGMAGAAALAARAAARVGAGLVSIATRAAHASLLDVSVPEVMCHASETATDLRACLERATVVLVGPGLGRREWGREMLNALLEADRPMVADADALNLLAAEPLRRDNWILTPHPGEAARLLDCDAREVQSDRFAAVRSLQQRYGGVVVLKGSGTLVDSGSDPLAVCDSGNPGLATGGTGDILSGAIAGLWAQNDATDPAARTLAARLGAVVHGAAGDWAARDGERGLIASDLLPWLREAVNPVR